MFKFLKRAFINNDKKKDEIILSDILYIDKIQVIFYLFLLEEKQKQL
jgi:hypothetical protein